MHSMMNKIETLQGRDCQEGNVRNQNYLEMFFERKRKLENMSVSAHKPQLRITIKIIELVR